MTRRRDITLIGIPMDEGASEPGCRMGPEALRIAGIAEVLGSLGHGVTDRGNLHAAAGGAPSVTGRANRAGRVAAWMRAIDAGCRGLGTSVPVFLGGDHALSAATVNAMAGRAAGRGRKLHVLWLDAHSDINTPASSPSGNIHGMPVAALTGAVELGFLYDGIARHELPAEAFHMLGIRSVDPEERRALRARGVHVCDMRRIDELGTARLVAEIVGQVQAAGAELHVSLDVDFLDPGLAPGVGTQVPGGATFREAHLAMEMLSESGLVTSLDLVELNPFLDHAGQSARVLVDLAASLFGRSIT